MRAISPTQTKTEFMAALTVHGHGLCRATPALSSSLCTNSSLWNVFEVFAMIFTRDASFHVPPNSTPFFLLLFRASQLRLQRVREERECVVILISLHELRGLRNYFCAFRMQMRDQQMPHEHIRMQPSHRGFANFAFRGKKKLWKWIVVVPWANECNDSDGGCTATLTAAAGEKLYLIKQTFLSVAFSAFFRLLSSRTYSAPAPH